MGEMKARRARGATADPLRILTALERAGVILDLPPWTGGLSGDALVHWLVRNGMTTRTLAEALGVHMDTVRRAYARFGGRSTRSARDGERAAVRSLHRQGLSARAIERHTDVPRSTVRRWINRFRRENDG